MAEWTEETFRAYVAAVRWQFAKTMPHDPHEYTVRKWGDPEEFEAAVVFIREQGYDDLYKRRWYRAYDLDGWKYWTMGAPVGQTTIINRKDLSLATTQP